jgi:hypothetical protein
MRRLFVFLLVSAFSTGCTASADDCGGDEACTPPVAAPHVAPEETAPAPAPTDTTSTTDPNAGALRKKQKVEQIITHGP